MSDPIDAEEARTLGILLAVAVVGTCVGVWCLLGVSCFAFIGTYCSCGAGDNAPRSSSQESQLEMSHLVTTSAALRAKDTGGASHAVQCSCKAWVEIPNSSTEIRCPDCGGMIENAPTSPRAPPR